MFPNPLKAAEAAGVPPCVCFHALSQRRTTPRIFSALQKRYNESPLHFRSTGIFPPSISGTIWKYLLPLFRHITAYKDKRQTIPCLLLADGRFRGLEVSVIYKRK